MGQEFCQGCINGNDNPNEKNLSQDIGYKGIKNPSLFTIGTKSRNNMNVPLSNYLSPDFSENTRRTAQKNTFNLNNFASDYSNNHNRSEFQDTPNIYSEADKAKLKEIILNYKVRLIISSFRKLKKMKDDAHKTFEINKFLREERENIMIEGDDDIDVDLFPEEIYNYIGSKFNDKKDGLGMQIFPESNSYYFGLFLNDRRIGIGKFYDPTKNYIYEGDILNNYVTGCGFYKNTLNNVEYMGEFKSNRKDGIGIETYQDTSYYQGQFSNGKKEGFGVYNWSDGSNYQGEWRNNSLEGYGTYKFKDGSIYTGEWINNKMNGFGDFTFPGIKTYLGYFKDDMKSGFGIIIWYQEPKAFIGFWGDNKQNGLGKFVNESKIRFGRWENGKKVEKFADFNEFEEQLNSEGRVYINIFKLEYKELLKFTDKILNND